MNNKYISMIRGDTLSFNLEFEELETDLSSAFFTCKESYSHKETVFQKSLNNGITKLETGKYHVRVAPDDTAEIEAGKYYYDLQIGAGEDIYTVLIGVLEIIPDVTTQGG